MFAATYRFRFSLLLVVLGCCVGCGSEEYQPISGSVTWQDQALAKGVITFYPNGPGTTVGGEVIGGNFALSKANGPTPGKYRVEIIAFRPTGKKEFDIDAQEEIDVEEQFLPTQYNRNSKLQIEVTLAGENVFNFDLKP